MIYVLVALMLLILNIRFSRYGNRFYWFFQLSHLLMGFLMSGFLHSELFLNYLQIISMVLLIGLAWELWEYVAVHSYLISKFIKKHLDYSIDKEGLKDNLFDLLLDLGGALLFLLLKAL